jgi:uncharacterized Ntn-hydrolase superfamily protein
MIPALRERTSPWTFRRLVLVLVAGACATITSPAQATYSIIARDPVTGEIGAAVQSHWFQVHRVIWVEPGVGAVATQSLADFTYGPAGLTLLRLGRGAEESLTGLLATDAAADVRQVAILDFDGSIAAHTGASCIAEAGQVIGDDFSVQANLMEKDTVPEAMARAFRASRGDLADRLLAALEAAQAEGGDIRGQQSAALLVAANATTGKPWLDMTFDLRVDDDPQPVAELRRLLSIVRAYRSMDEGDLAIERADFAAAEAAYGTAAKLAPGNAEVLFWYGVSLANAGRIDDAAAQLAEAYAAGPELRALLPRLPPAGLLTVEPKVVRRLTDATLP